MFEISVAIYSMIIKINSISPSLHPKPGHIVTRAERVEKKGLPMASV